MNVKIRIQKLECLASRSVEMPELVYLAFGRGEAQSVRMSAIFIDSKLPLLWKPSAEDVFQEKTRLIVERLKQTKTLPSEEAVTEKTALSHQIEAKNALATHSEQANNRCLV